MWPTGEPHAAAHYPATCEKHGSGIHNLLPAETRINPACLQGRHPLNTNLECCVLCMACRWLDAAAATVVLNGSSQLPAKQGAELKPYHIRVFTSRIRGAGTDANVFIKTIGLSGAGDWTELPARQSTFQQGQVCRLHISSMAFAAVGYHALLPNPTAPLQSLCLTHGCGSWQCIIHCAALTFLPGFECLHDVLLLEDSYRLA